MSVKMYARIIGSVVTLLVAIGLYFFDHELAKDLWWFIGISAGAVIVAFLITPDWCCYGLTGYARTPTSRTTDNNLTVGRALTISGAAIDPNMSMVSPPLTSLMMALCPEAVDMGRFSAAAWYARSAEKASPELGAEGRRGCPGSFCVRSAHSLELIVGQRVQCRDVRMSAPAAATHRDGGAHDANANLRCHTRTFLRGRGMYHQ